MHHISGFFHAIISLFLLFIIMLTHYFELFVEKNKWIELNIHTHINRLSSPRKAYLANILLMYMYYNDLNAFQKINIGIYKNKKLLKINHVF